MYITRHMEKPVMELNEQYPVLLLTGPRQVGKTTMLEHLIAVSYTHLTLPTIYSV